MLDSVQKHTKSRNEILVGIYFFSTIDAHFIWSVIKVCPWDIYWTATMTNLMSYVTTDCTLLSLWDNTLRWLFDATVAMCMCIADVIYNVLFYYFFLLKQYHRWILMDVFVKKSQTHVDLLSVKQFQNLWHWCKNKAFTIHRSKREGLHFLSIKSPRYKANLFTPYQLATSAAKKRDKMPDIFALWSCFKSNVEWKRTEISCFCTVTIH